MLSEGGKQMAMQGGGLKMKAEADHSTREALSLLVQAVLADEESSTNRTPALQDAIDRAAEVLHHKAFPKQEELGELPGFPGQGRNF